MSDEIKPLMAGEHLTHCSKCGSKILKDMVSCFLDIVNAKGYLLKEI